MIRQKIRKRLAENNFKAKSAIEKKDAEYAAEYLLRADECKVILKLLK